MKSVGIIANPFSGKDVRRLYSYALTIGNSEKLNLMERLILGAQDLGVENFYIMPDPYGMGDNIISDLKNRGDLKSSISLLDYKPEGNDNDTLKATRILNEIKVDCMVVLGGDGTHRLVATVNSDIPLIAISSGTNNVYPKFHEGTIAGMAAAVVCEYGLNKEYITRDKIIEVYKDGEIVDYALIDVSLTNQQFIGSRAIENVEDISELIVSRSSPYSIGFSSVIGVQAISNAEDDFGYRAKLQSGNSKILAPFSAGKMMSVNIETPIKMPLGQMHVCKPQVKGSIALDGERTMHFNKEDILGFVIRRKGPLGVDVKAALEYGVENKFFEASCIIK